MLTSAANEYDLHGMTMDMFRGRILGAFYAAGQEPSAELVEELARLMDMSAAERVLDEQDLRDVPNPEHPAVRDLRARLRHAEALIERLSVAPAMRAAAMIQQGELTADEREMLTRFVQSVHRDVAVPSRSGCDEAANVMAADALSHVLNVIEQRVAFAETDHLPHSTALAAALRETADDVRTIRMTLFRDAACLELLDAPEASLNVVDRLPESMREGVLHGLMSS